MRFLLGQKDLSGTNAERRVKEVIAKGSAATQVYDLKEGTKKFNANGKRYNAEQLAYVGEELKEMIHYFGYAKVSSDPENFTGFFNYEEEDPELLRTYKAFEAHRENSIDWVCSLNDDELNTFQYQLADKSKEVDIMNFATSEKACRAIGHYSQNLLYKRSVTHCD